MEESWSNLWDGMACVGAARQPVDDDEVQCHDEASFYWSGLPFAFGFNLDIPVLIKH